MLDMNMNPGTLMAIGIFLSLVGLFLTWHGLAAKRRWARRDDMGEFNETEGRSGEEASDREVQISALQAELNQVLRTRHNLVLGVRSVIEAAGTGREVDRDSRMQLRSIGQALPYVLSGRRDWEIERTDTDEVQRYRGRVGAHCNKHGFALPADSVEATNALLSLAAYLLQPNFVVPIEGLRSRYPVKGWDLRAYELGTWQTPTANAAVEELGCVPHTVIRMPLIDPSDVRPGVDEAYEAQFAGAEIVYLIYPPGTSAEVALRLSEHAEAAGVESDTPDCLVIKEMHF